MLFHTGIMVSRDLMDLQAALRKLTPTHRGVLSIEFLRCHQDDLAGISLGSVMSESFKVAVITCRTGGSGEILINVAVMDHSVNCLNSAEQIA